MQSVGNERGEMKMINNYNDSNDKNEVIYEAYVDYAPDMIEHWTKIYLEEDYEIHKGYIFCTFIDEYEELTGEYLIRIDDIVDKMIYYASIGYGEFSKELIKEAIEMCPWYKFEIVPLDSMY